MMRNLLQKTSALAPRRLAPRGDSGFIIPPDTNDDQPNDSLTYAYGDFMDAEWWCDFEYITMQLGVCNFDTKWNITSEFLAVAGSSALSDRTCGSKHAE
jgi:hypothetical protein